jgi:hypothetical protein
MWADILTGNEAEFTLEAIRILSSAPWASSLLSRLEQQGGVSSRNIPLLFEARVAYALNRLGITVSYEYKTGSGQKSADFRLQSKPQWLIEAVSLGESDAIKAATKRSGDLFSLYLSSRADDRTQSEEGELIKAMERIAEKGCKFPEPASSAFHVILADVRGYLGGGGDHDDYREMAYGTGAASPEHSHWWGDQPIRGLFDPKNPTRTARLIQERVHFIGFIAERRYHEGEIQNSGFYVWNPRLFTTQEIAERAFATYPLRPLKVG